MPDQVEHDRDGTVEHDRDGLGKIALTFGFGELFDGVAEHGARHRAIAGFRVKPGMRD